MKCVFFSFVYLDAAKSTTKLFACFGESIELNCQDGETIEVQDAYYELLKKDDKRCTLVSNTTFLCQEKQLRDQVQYQCGGKGKCLLKQDVQDVTNECLPAMYLTVEFQCSKLFVTLWHMCTFNSAL